MLTQINSRSEPNSKYSPKILKAMETNIKKYGVPFPGQRKSVMEKVRETNLKLYGVEYVTQNVYIFQKAQRSAFKRKKYTFPSGKEVYIQGYEHFALDELLKANIVEDDIITDAVSMPTIKYKLGDTTHSYFPDIFMINLNCQAFFLKPGTLT